ncbi:MAG TPA: GTP-binding protein [Terracidiphilus sp.]|nr:GTP-binding protein [Terracidiphilus sp.]
MSSTEEIVVTLAAGPDSPEVDTAVDAQAEDARIEQMLAEDRAKDLLRFSTAGSVDDGKSTLIGRLLYDSRSVYDDHIQSVTKNKAIDFALLTDGLRAEREQGITIDVAYRYFSTVKRKFIIADTPGHEQYTRNMATGASTADVAIVLVDARKGILNQTRRHTAINALLGIPIVIAAINKMDLVDFSQEIFDQHRAGLEALAKQLGIAQLITVPVSALEGDNIVHRSERTPWYVSPQPAKDRRAGDPDRGPSMLELLETLPLAIERNATGLRFPVQRVVRPHQDFRGFAGQIAAGTVRLGDEIVALPSGRRTRVRSIETWEGQLEEAHAPQSVVLTLEDEVDLSRGEMIASVETLPHKTRHFEATVVWMQNKPLVPGATYVLKHTSQTVRAKVVAIKSRIDVENLGEREALQLELNDIGEVVLETSRPIMADLYGDSRTTGSIILIDPEDNATAGAGMVRAIVDATDADTQQAIHGILAVGNRAELAAELEQKLLSAGALVLRTRAELSPALLAIARFGSVVLVENDEAGPITLTAVHGADPTPHELQLGQSGKNLADAIFDELERLGAIPNGEDNDDGLGI